MNTTVKNPFAVALEKEGVTGKLADVAWSIYSQESGRGRNTKTSNAGAVGGMQVIPTTFAEVADKDWDIKDPEHNARAGIRYIKKLDKMAGGDPALIGAGYYGGPGGLQKAKQGIAVADPRNPNAPNTLQYGQQVASRVNGSKAPTEKAVEAPQAIDLPDMPKGGALPEEALREPVMALKGGSYAMDDWAKFNAALGQQEVQPAVVAQGSYIPLPNMESALGSNGYYAMANYGASPRVPAQRVKPFKGWTGFNV